MLIETAYFPPVSWMACAKNHSSIRLEAWEHYQKGSWRNRCHIAGPNGMQRLSIPLKKGKHQQTLIRQVEISYDEPWQTNHWRSICTAYGNAPYFEHYAPDLEQFYIQKTPLLFDFNLQLLEWIWKQLGWKQAIQSTGQFELEPQSEPDFRGIFNPNKPVPSSWQTPHYPQVFTERFGFQANLSVLDLLLCSGKQSNFILTLEDV
jgi:hypothetical protein